ncbi:MAG: hypothetical protein MI807_04040 [Verrucomicrobiales bacterium]|nr:hypothetical protein [Verrucomicrobiales bacterium]
MKSECANSARFDEAFEEAAEVNIYWCPKVEPCERRRARGWVRAYNQENMMALLAEVCPDLNRDLVGEILEGVGATSAFSNREEEGVVFPGRFDGLLEGASRTELSLGWYESFGGPPEYVDLMELEWTPEVNVCGTYPKSAWASSKELSSFILSGCETLFQESVFCELVSAQSRSAHLFFPESESPITHEFGRVWRIRSSTGGSAAAVVADLQGVLRSASSNPAQKRVLAEEMDAVETDFFGATLLLESNMEGGSSLLINIYGRARFLFGACFLGVMEASEDGELFVDDGKTLVMLEHSHFKEPDARSDIGEISYGEYSPNTAPRGDWCSCGSRYPVHRDGPCDPTDLRHRAAEWIAAQYEMGDRRGLPYPWRILSSPAFYLRHPEEEEFDLQLAEKEWETEVISKLFV